MIVARTPRLLLRHATLDDAPSFLALLTSDGFVRGVGDRGVRTLDDARAYVQARCVDAYAADGYAGYAVVRARDGAFVGQAGLVQRAPHAAVELGYALLPSFYGHGYAREAAEATLDLARARGLDSLDAVVLPGNVASLRVLDALGFALVQCETPKDAPPFLRYHHAL